MAEAIIHNSAALNALKRHQLVSLSKRYGLKASGKNGDMVDRLQAYAAGLPSEMGMNIPAPEPTPHPSRQSIPDQEPDSPTPLNQAEMVPSASSIPELDKKASMISVNSEKWEILSESGASLISPMKGVQAKDGTVRSWKSAGNGEALSDFGPTGEYDQPESNTASSRNSVFSFAASLKRSGTKTFLGSGSRSTSHSSNLTATPGPSTQTKEPEPEDDPMEPMPIPPSPASTVGAPRRHSRLSLFERPSTLRLCSPTPAPGTPRKRGEDLPFVGSAHKLQQLKDRRSLAPLRSPVGSDTGLPGLSRKSLPVLHHGTTSIYPPLPTFQPDTDAPPVPTIPGQYPVLTPKPSTDTFTFGSPDHAVSSEQFSQAAQAILQQMNDKLPQEARMGGEVLKGKQADMRRMVSVTSGLGEGGWGLMERFEGKRDRYAEVHEREFAKMRSISNNTLTSQPKIKPPRSTTKLPLIPSTPGQKRKHSSGSTTSEMPSAPNGGPLEGPRQTKRSRMSPGPNVLGSLREAGRSVMTLLGDVESKSPQKRTPAGKKQRTRLSMRATGLRNRLSMFRSNFRKASIAPEKTAAERSAELHKSLRRRSAELSTIVKRSPDLPINPPMSLNSTRPKVRSGKPRLPSTSAQTVMSTSTSSSKVPQRKPLPDFAAGRIASGSSSKLSSSVSSTHGLGKGSINSSMRKQSQADMIRNARKAPAPPTVMDIGSATKSTEADASIATTTRGVPKRSSTLYATTASSRARMQATVKPPPKPASRPLPMAPPPVPTIAPPTSFRSHGLVTHNLFGAGESRENLFEENFHSPPPPNPASPSISLTVPTTTPGRSGMPSPGGPRSPLKFGGSGAGAASKMRHKNSGLTAIKSKGNLREEVEVQRRKADMRAKAERRAEERELREMLGDLGENRAI